VSAGQVMERRQVNPPPARKTSRFGGIVLALAAGVGVWQVLAVAIPRLQVRPPTTEPVPLHLLTLPAAISAGLFVVGLLILRSPRNALAWSLVGVCVSAVGSLVQWTWWWQTLHVGAPNAFGIGWWGLAWPALTLAVSTGLAAALLRSRSDRAA
jgi:hypothetical protein